MRVISGLLKKLLLASVIVTIGGSLLLFFQRQFSEGILLGLCAIGLALGRSIPTTPTSLRSLERGLLYLPSERSATLLSCITTLGAVSFLIVERLVPSLLSVGVLVLGAGLVLILSFGAMSNRLHVILLSEIIMLAVGLRALAWFSFPSGYVGVDPWVHARLITEVMSLGTTPQVTGYQSFPFMHVAAAVLADVAGVDVRESMFLAVAGPATVLCILGVYLIGLRYTRNPTASLASAFIFAVAPDLVYWGWNPIPMSLGIGLFFLGMLVATGSAKYAKRIQLCTLIFLASLATHPIGAVVLLFYFVAVSVFSTVSKFAGLGLGNPSHTRIYSLTLFLMLSAYWVYIASISILPLLLNGLRLGFRVNALILPVQSTTSLLTLVESSIPSGLVILFASLGTVVFFRSRPSLQTLSQLSFYWAIVALAFIGQIGGLTGIFPARWSVVGLALLTIPAGYGVSSILNARRKFAGKAAVSSLLLIFMIASIIGPSLMPSPLLGGQRPRLGLVASESSASDWVMARSTVSVRSDPLMALQLGSPLDARVGDSSPIITRGAGPYDLLVYREAASDKSIYVSEPGMVFWRITHIDRSKSVEFRMASNAVYDSGSTVIFYGS